MFKQMCLSPLPRYRPVTPVTAVTPLAHKSKIFIDCRLFFSYLSRMCRGHGRILPQIF